MNSHKNVFVDRVQNYIGGQWKASANPEYVPSPTPQRASRSAPSPWVGQGRRRRREGRRRPPSPPGASSPRRPRAKYLFALRDKMDSSYDELLAICTQEHGKTLEESKGDVRRTIDNVEVACGMPSMMMNAARCSTRSPPASTAVSIRQPMGVFGIIAPYNFPSMVPYWFLPYAIATGNTVVVKPSEQVPFSQVAPRSR